MKPVRVSVFAVIETKEKILAVQRPENDEHLPGMWGLPATTLDEHESIEDGLHRLGREKLNVDLAPTDFIARGDQEREAYILHGEEYRCTITNGVPSVANDAPGTQYTNWQWAQPEILEEIAQHGSLCTQLYLDHIGHKY